MSEIVIPEPMVGWTPAPIVLGLSQGTTVVEAGSQPAKPEDVPTVKTQIENIVKLGDSVPGQSKIARDFDLHQAMGYGRRDGDAFRFNMSYYHHRLETATALTEAQRSQAVEIVSKATLRTGSGAEDLRAVHSALKQKLGDEAGTQAGNVLIMAGQQVEFITLFLKAPDAQKGFDDSGNAFLVYNEGSSGTLLPNGVINYIDNKNGKTFELVPGDGQLRPKPPPITEGPGTHLPGATSPRTAESSAMDGYRDVTTVTVSLRQKGVGGSQSVKEGDVLQAKLTQKGGMYFIVTPEKMYALPADRIKGSGEAADASALRLAQDYLRYGYVTVGSKAEDISSLAISDINKNTGQVVTADLINKGDGSYTLGQESFKAPSLAEAVEKAISLVRMGSFLPDPTERVPASPFSPRGKVV
jgi:hypothetical protein